MTTRKKAASKKAPQIEENTPALFKTDAALVAGIVNGLRWQDTAENAARKGNAPLNPDGTVADCFASWGDITALQVESKHAQGAAKDAKELFSVYCHRMVESAVRDALGAGVDPTVTVAAAFVKLADTATKAEGVDSINKLSNSSAHKSFKSRYLKYVGMGMLPGITGGKKTVTPGGKEKQLTCDSISQMDKLAKEWTPEDAEQVAEHINAPEHAFKVNETKAPAPLDLASLRVPVKRKKELEPEFNRFLKLLGALGEDSSNKHVAEFCANLDKLQGIVARSLAAKQAKASKAA